MDETITEKPISKSAPKTSTKVLATERQRWSETFKHHLFKLKPKICKRNRSFQLFKPRIKEQEHAHIYHSVSRKGTPQKYCAAMAGHFHEIKTEWDGDRLVKAVCGPPLRFRYRQDRSGRTAKVMEAVIWKGEDPEGSQDVIDKHIHEFDYLGSEMLTRKVRTDANTQQMFANQISNKYGQEILAKAQETIKGQ